MSLEIAPFIEQKRSARASLDPDTRLNRGDTAAALTACGFKTSAATLATKASRGGGPPYQLWGRQPTYRWGDALQWAESRLSKTVSSTSEMEAA